MARRFGRWRLATAIYVIINVGGAISAAIRGEQMHLALHVGLLLLGMVAYPIWRLTRRVGAVDQATAQLSDQRVEYLQHSVDAMALELERLGEAQRFQEKLRERGETPPPKRDK